MERAIVGVFLTSLIAFPLTESDTSLLIAKTIVVFLGFLVLSDELGHAIAWSAAADKTEAIDQRLERTDFVDLEPMLAVFSDYNVATAVAPPIPTSVYKAEREKLNKLWKARQVDDPVR